MAKTMPFGPYKGKALTEVPEGYLRGFRAAGEKLGSKKFTKLDEAIAKELGFKKEDDDMTTAELLKEHNRLAVIAGEDELASWKRKKSELEERTEELKAKVKKPKKAKSKKAKESGSKVTVKEIAEAALLEVVGEDDKGNKLGLSYGEVLERVREAIPDCNTSVRSLAWYASRLRANGETVPFRPPTNGS